MKKKLKTSETYVVLSGLLVILFLICYSMNPMGLQRNIFFRNGGDFFADYYNVLWKSLDFDPYAFGQGIIDAERAYPPLAYVVQYLIGQVVIPQQYNGIQFDTISLLWISIQVIFTGLGILYIATRLMCNQSKSIRTMFFLTTFFSGVMLYSLERANLVLLTAFCISIFFMWYQEENAIKRNASYIALAIAAALKVYPAVLGLLVVKKKDYRNTALLIVYGLAFFFLPFLLMKGKFANIPILLKNIQRSSEFYGSETVHLERFGWRLFQSTNSDFSNFYKVCTAICSIMTITLIWFDDKPWRVINMLILLIVIIPANSYTYYGLYIIPTLALFLNTNEKDLIYTLITMLFLLIFNPLNLIYLPSGISLRAVLINLSTTLIWIILIVNTTVDIYKKRKYSPNSNT